MEDGGGILKPPPGPGTPKKPRPNRLRYLQNSSEWIDTKIELFCDLSDFIWFWILCNKNWKRMKNIQIYVDRVYSMGDDRQIVSETEGSD